MVAFANQESIFHHLAEKAVPTAKGQIVIWVTLINFNNIRMSLFLTACDVYQLKKLMLQLKLLVHKDILTRWWWLRTRSDSHLRKVPWFFDFYSTEFLLNKWSMFHSFGLTFTSFCETYSTKANKHLLSLLTVARQLCKITV